MIVYMATWLMEESQKRVLDWAGKRERLISYAYLVPPLAKPASLKYTIPEYLEGPFKPLLFLDSGAYTAWAKGDPIDIDAYAEYAIKHKEAWHIVANLDVIPGKWGVDPTPTELEKSAEQGWENYRYLSQRLADTGLTLMHIYHQGEPIKWLKKLMDEMEYFGISPNNAFGTTEKCEWLDSLMPLLTDHKGRPLRKFHSFGATAFRVMLGYPWYSIDSTSWVLAGRYGACFMNLNGRLRKHEFSSRSPRQANTTGGLHFRNLSNPGQQEVRKYLASLGDYTPEMLAEDYGKRDEVNALFFVNLEKTWIDRPWGRQRRLEPFDL